MRNLWIYIALLATLYGMLALAAVTIPRPPPPSGELQPGQPPSGGGFAPPGGMAPDGRGGMPPGMQPEGMTPQAPGPAAGRQDFEGPLPQIVTRPANAVEIGTAPEHGRVLRWRLSADEGKGKLLALPLAARPQAQTLVLEWRAEPQTKLALGLRLRDGTIYRVERQAGPAWERLELPLATLKPGLRFRQAAPQLDPAEIEALVVMALDHKPRITGQQNRAAVPEQTLPAPAGDTAVQMIELDNVELR